jgi:predicted nucleotide-binding protein
MELTKSYRNLRFPERTLREAIEALETLSTNKKRGKFSSLRLVIRDEEWRFDNVEEFFAVFPDAESAVLSYSTDWQSVDWKYNLTYSFDQYGSTVIVHAEQRHEIHKLMNIFTQSVHLATAIRSEAEVEVDAEVEDGTKDEISIFIGHGRSGAWGELRNHLQDKHGYRIVAYETGSRAGHSIRDILEEMLNQSSIAFLVLTGEDETADETIRARQNVIHETGLFQGRLGFSRAIVLLEEGVESLSNLQGIQHISFAKGHINGTFGDVLAVIRREFLTSRS